MCDRKNEMMPNEVQAKHPRASSVTEVHRCSKKVGLDSKQANNNYERALKEPNPRSQRLPSRGRVPLQPVSMGSLGWVPLSKEPRLRPGLPRVSRSRITPRVGDTIQKEHRIGPHNGGPNLHAQLPHYKWIA